VPKKRVVKEKQESSKLKEVGFSLKHEVSWVVVEVEEARGIEQVVHRIGEYFAEERHDDPSAVIEMVADCLAAVGLDEAMTVLNALAGSVSSADNKDVAAQLETFIADI
jgi:hypothetical protein